MMFFGKKTVFFLAAILKTEKKMKILKIISRVVLVVINSIVISIWQIPIQENEEEKKEVK